MKICRFWTWWGFKIMVKFSPSLLFQSEAISFNWTIAMMQSLKTHNYKTGPRIPWMFVSVVQTYTQKNTPRKLNITKKQRDVCGVLTALAELSKHHCSLIKKLGHVCGCLLYYPRRCEWQYLLNLICRILYAQPDFFRNPEPHNC